MNSLPDIDSLLSGILRHEHPTWPAAGGADFQLEFLQRAAHHGVRALVFDRVQNADAWEGWPVRVQAELRDATRAAAAVDMLRSHALREVLAAFRDREIPVLITKGGALANSVYGHSRLRTRVDTDLFIGIEHIERVRETMVSLGYDIVPPVYKSHQFICAKNWHETLIQFDIHWRILNAPQFARSITFEEAWKRSVPVPGLEGARTLDEVDALLLACLHLKGSAFHDENRLIWLYDIHLLGATLSPEMWATCVQRAVDKRIHTTCLDGLSRAGDRFSTVIPAEVILALGIDLPRPGIYASSNLSLLMDDLQKLPGWCEKTGLLRELFFPSPDALMEKYQKTNRAWLPLLYCRQLLGGAAKRLSLQ